ncbi:hypothetical protein BDV59DRAFT_174003 [Aspergillus ambiguus]|uniref:uncharacterized protein n=1 Tax=Aspergillus ambiguus TaxID=176160 RepID=UPI003CCDFFEA
MMFVRLSQTSSKADVISSSSPLDGSDTGSHLSLTSVNCVALTVNFGRFRNAPIPPVIICDAAVTPRRICGLKATVSTKEVMADVD